MLYFVSLSNSSISSLTHTLGHTHIFADCATGSPNPDLEPRKIRFLAQLYNLTSELFLVRGMWLKDTWWMASNPWRCFLCLSFPPSPSPLCARPSVSSVLAGLSLLHTRFRVGPADRSVRPTWLPGVQHQVWTVSSFLYTLGPFSTNTVLVLVPG